MPTFNYPDYANEIRNIICSNPIAVAVASASRCDASNSDEHFSQSPTFPRIRNNSAYAMDVDSVRNILEGMTQNAVFGDLAVLRDRHFSPRSRYHADVLRNLDDCYSRLEAERLKKLISSKATIRYSIEVK